MAAGPRLNSKAETAAIFLSTACFVLLADLLTKSLAFSRLRPFTPYEVIPGFLDFYLNRNRGAVFGIGQGKGTFFILFTLVAAVVIVWFVAKHGRTSRFFTFGLGCVFGGALGNLVDRLASVGTNGGVRDFIDAHVGARHWPTFNVADMAICVGAAVLVFCAFRTPKETRDDSTRRRGDTGTRGDGESGD